MRILAHGLLAMMLVFSLIPAAAAEDRTSRGLQTNYTSAHCKVSYVQVSSDKGPILVASVDCGNDTTCPDNTVCCDAGSEIVCCDASVNVYCPANNTCYQYYDQAQSECPGAVSACYRAAN